jgi:transposase
VLGFSRALFVHFTCRMVLQELLYGLVLAFEYFGGLPRKLLFDYVVCHIIEVLLPGELCGRWRHVPRKTSGSRPAPAT